MCVSSLIVSASLQPHGTVVQAPLSMEFSRQEYWSGLPSPGDLPNQESNPGLLYCRQILYHLSCQYKIIHIGSYHLSYQGSLYRLILIDNHLKCKRINCTNQKT